MTSEESEFNSLEYKRVKFVSQEYEGILKFFNANAWRGNEESKKFGIDDIVSPPRWVEYPCYSQTRVIRILLSVFIIIISTDIDCTTIIYPFIIRSLSILTARVYMG